MAPHVDRRSIGAGPIRRWLRRDPHASASAFAWPGAVRDAGDGVAQRATWGSERLDSTGVEHRCLEARLSHKSGAAAQLPNATQNEPF